MLLQRYFVKMRAEFQMVTADSLANVYADAGEIRKRGRRNLRQTRIAVE